MIYDLGVHYCPECGWNTEISLWPGPNGLVLRRQCSFCGWIGGRIADCE